MGGSMSSVRELSEVFTDGDEVGFVRDLLRAAAGSAVCG
jgi:hypothetical protein